MIDNEILFETVGRNLALRCESDQDSTGLIHIAQSAVTKKIRDITAYPKDVGQLWIWLENQPVKITARFEYGGGRKNDVTRDISNLALQINACFKQGASGVEIFMPLADLDRFIDDISPIRDDLFFNKNLNIAIDINEIGSDDWGGVFEKINAVGTTMLVLCCAGDKKSRDYFTGRVYAMLNAMESMCNINIGFVVGNDAIVMEQVWRLAEKIRPNLLPRLKFFLDA